MKAVVKKVSPKNGCVVRIDVISGDFVIASGWCKLSTAKAIDAEVEIPKGYLPQVTRMVNELGQNFNHIDWVVA